MATLLCEPELFLCTSALAQDAGRVHVVTGLGQGGPADSTAFRLVLRAAKESWDTDWRADPSPLRPNFDPPIYGFPPLEESYASAAEQASLRRGVLERAKIPPDSAAHALNCILNGLETPEQRAAVQAHCPGIEEHSGVAVSLPWHEPPSAEPNGLMGRLSPWRVRAISYGVSPTQRGGWSMFDYYLERGPAGRWDIVGRTTVLHAD